MVLEIIREKDQADFRGVRSDFSARMGGGSIEVRLLLSALLTSLWDGYWGESSNCTCNL